VGGNGNRGFVCCCGVGLAAEPIASDVANGQYSFTDFFRNRSVSAIAPLTQQFPCPTEGV